MPEETPIVDDTTTQPTAVEEPTEPTTEPNQPEGELDYNQEFNEAVEKFDRAERNREAYMKRKGIAEEPEQAIVPEVNIEAMVEEAIKKQLPKLQSTLVEDTVESTLNELSQGNEAKKKLIRFHFENSVGLNGTIRERMENALLIADKKKILKTQTELAVALQNRQQLPSSAIGISTEGPQVKDNFFSPEQIANLKARGWDDKKIERLKGNMRNSK